jgi:hypothetical protein
LGWFVTPPPPLPSAPHQGKASTIATYIGHSFIIKHAESGDILARRVVRDEKGFKVSTINTEPFDTEILQRTQDVSPHTTQTPHDEAMSHGPPLCPIATPTLQWLKAIVCPPHHPSSSLRRSGCGAGGAIPTSGASGRTRGSPPPRPSSRLWGSRRCASRLRPCEWWREGVLLLMVTMMIMGDDDDNG